MLLTVKTTVLNPPSYILSFSDHWMPPTYGWIKCNIDGAFDDTAKDNGAGYVMRDFSSKDFFCDSIVFDVDSAEEAEARAIWAGLKKVVELKLTRIIVESDAQDLVSQFSIGSFGGNLRTDAIFKDIQFFASSLSGCIFSFQPRTCNFVAQELAKWAKANKSSMYWSVPPVWLRPFVEEDH
ncbi:uncharacterized protein LOC113318829 [Papaver somniferum]|uniref:uncharacterized protein LOC113318829 n=1 Tax=Papaver somniferum TaxID=3469 RepID=UPI000E6FDE88|nr:uncharacterized protein LOC113318829 [Papaver somniferum]